MVCFRILNLLMESLLIKIFLILKCKRRSRMPRCVFSPAHLSHRNPKLSISLKFLPRRPMKSSTSKNRIISRKWFNRSRTVVQISSFVSGVLMMRPITCCCKMDYQLFVGLVELKLNILRLLREEELFPVSQSLLLISLVRLVLFVKYLLVIPRSACSSLKIVPIPML